MQMHLLAGRPEPESTNSQPPPTNSATLINQDSGNFEYYTPPFIVEAARAVLGTIDLDPASSPLANLTVRARHIFTLADDGLSQPWHGNVWMNHPFGRERNPIWVNNLCTEYTSDNVRAACCITFAATSERWFQPLLDYPLCFLHPRTNYLLPDGSPKRGVTKGSVVAYLGDNVFGFIEEFEQMGRVMLPAERFNARKVEWPQRGGSP